MFTDEELDTLRTEPKQVINPGARWTTRGGHRRRNYTLKAAGTPELRFRLYERQNASDPVDFSCGLILIRPGGAHLPLVRYNGANHPHGAIEYRCHIHTTTAQALSEGRKPDHNAEETDRYASLPDAFRCLVRDCSVEGLNVAATLFNQ